MLFLASSIDTIDTAVHVLGLTKGVKFSVCVCRLVYVCRLLCVCVCVCVCGVKVYIQTVSQYKSKGPFADISASQHDMGVPVERNYFGSRHGKGPCDREAAVVKNHVASAVKCRDVIISNACDFYEYLQKSSLNKQPPQVGCPHGHFLRSFVFVGENEICHSRPHRNIKTVPGTHQFHHVNPGGTGRLCARHLTCLCDGCAGGGQCQQEDIVGRWREYILIPTSGML